jgi:hypothetical protein
MHFLGEEKAFNPICFDDVLIWEQCFFQQIFIPFSTTKNWEFFFG